MSLQASICQPIRKAVDIFEFMEKLKQPNKCIQGWGGGRRTCLKILAHMENGDSSFKNEAYFDVQLFSGSSVLTVEYRLKNLPP